MRTLAIFGARVRSDGGPSLPLRSRVEHAVDLLNKESFDRVIVSGGARTPSPSEASVVVQLLERAGIATPLIVDETAMTTMGNIRFLRRWLHENPEAELHIVTDPFHAPRVRMALRAYLVDARVRPTGHRASAAIKAREAVALTYYALRLILARIAGRLPKR